MERLKSALDHLDQAIGQLDSALTRRLERVGSERDSAAAALFEAERARLEQALAEAEARERLANEREAQARADADAAATRLDAAIERLRTLLEE
ncbi:DUF4164 family protein [Aerophototrophica crusticola]|uniref:DUF4164 family protein n=1 Tax=Aerophototrophica crusticola TaxID=1709002 RepID=A0A858R7G7_9PROT|nr:DUF4164 family protein [Rhodospirillaceae bacterium B3]